MVEVLIVIVIIVALGALVVPMARNIRNAAGSAKTVENLRKIQAANVTWARDNNGFFLGNDPSGSGGIWSHPWWGHMPFVSMLGINASGDELADAWATGYPEVLKCGLDVSVEASPRDDRNFTIAMNMTKWTHRQDGTPFTDDDNRGGKNGFYADGKILQSRIKYPAQLIMFYESAGFWDCMYTRLDWKGDKGTQTNGMAFRNKGGLCNVVFADGHAGNLTRKDVETENATTRRYFLWDAD